AHRDRDIQPDFRRIHRELLMIGGFEAGSIIEMRLRPHEVGERRRCASPFA
ncbi:MAG: hypothetical protein JRE18_10235, partial [Deltaproteobacteria bacterium]|nr:hypothetical protein [Deltaproteobacteria bacterium]